MGKAALADPGAQIDTARIAMATAKHAIIPILAQFKVPLPEGLVNSRSMMVSVVSSR